MTARGRIDIGRILIALALIVQIFAPVASNASIVRAAFDPLADVVFCHVDPTATADDGSSPVVDRHGFACDFCQLAGAGGHAPPPLPTAVPLPTATLGHAVWRVAVEAVVGPRLLDHIRGRAPPVSA